MLVHLRFGYPPYMGKSKNYRTGELLAGTSVASGIQVGHEYRIVLPPITCAAGSGELSNALSSLEWITQRPCWLVHGRPVGVGPDGEDLLERPVYMHRVQVAGVKRVCDDHAAWLPQERGAEFTDVMLPIYSNVTKILEGLGIPDTDWSPNHLLTLITRCKSDPAHCTYQQLWALRYAIQSAVRRMRSAGIQDSTTHKYFADSYTFDKFCHAYGLL